MTSPKTVAATTRSGRFISSLLSAGERSRKHGGLRRLTGGLGRPGLDPVVGRVVGDGEDGPSIREWLYPLPQVEDLLEDLDVFHGLPQRIGPMARTSSGSRSLSWRLKFHHMNARLFMITGYKDALLAKVVAGQASVFTDPLCSPTGFPFKV